VKQAGFAGGSAVEGKHAPAEQTRPALQPPAEVQAQLLVPGLQNTHVVVVGSQRLPR
jgi:hypothetical protein